MQAKETDFVMSPQILQDVIFVKASVPRKHMFQSVKISSCFYFNYP
jgi:hypothetical protein